MGGSGPPNVAPLLMTVAPLLAVERAAALAWYTSSTPPPRLLSSKAPTPGGPPVDLEATPIVPRRTVYGFVNRDILSPLSGTFDGANPAACTARRPDTTIPQQALFALNSDFIQDRAVAFAAAGLRAAPADEAGRVSWMVRRAFSRSPSEAETAAAIDFVHTQAASLESGLAADVPWQRLAHVLLAANEFHFVD